MMGANFQSHVLWLSSEASTHRANYQERTLSIECVPGCLKELEISYGVGGGGGGEGGQWCGNFINLVPMVYRLRNSTVM